MNRMGLAAEISARSGLTVKEASSALGAAVEAMADALAAGEEVNLHGFGSFRAKERRGRTGAHPTTRQPIAIPPSRGVAFTPAAALRRRLDPARETPTGRGRSARATGV